MKIQVMSTLALSSVLDALRSSLPGMELELAPTNVLRDRIDAGARGNVAILTDDAVQALAASGVLDGSRRVPLARSPIGVAVRRGGGSARHVHPSCSDDGAAGCAIGGDVPYRRAACS